MVTPTENQSDSESAMGSTNESVDLAQPWRKSFPICKPPTPKDKSDAERFIREFPGVWWGFLLDLGGGLLIHVFDAYSSVFGVYSYKYVYLYVFGRITASKYVSGPCA